ncbi:MAG: hypothetical protein EXX96DRAFT_521933 [Benjaminiella poitrasii]|nr:MAG: hypothetical protein EXX96DRAFT_521933 [Benjaminiella poitrasii]
MLQQQQKLQQQPQQQPQQPQPQPQPQLQAPQKQQQPQQLAQSTLPSTAIQIPNATVVKTEAQQKKLDQYISHDEKYQITLNKQHKQHIVLAQSKKSEIDVANNERRIRQQHRGLLTFGKGYDGYGNGKTGISNAPRIVYPGDKKRKEEMLVPIRLDVENEGYKIKDTFTWNMNETSVTPDQFAEITCEDLRLPVSVFAPLIANSIRDQIQDYFLNVSSMINDDQQENATKRASAYEEFIKCKRQKIEPNDTVKEELTETDNKSNKVELRTVIKLDIIVGNKVLNDQFEWDISCKENSPESFAEIMATELGLGGEFKTAIAHSIREQVHIYIKSLLLTGYEFGDGPVENDDLRRSFLPAVHNVIRDNDIAEKFTPTVVEATDAEIAKIEKIRTRESRRKRRGVRSRKGVTLPDREPIPTYRTIFASPPEHELSDEQFLKSIQAPQDATTHNQRKSALKARMNIAAEAAGVSLTSGQLMSSNSNDDGQYNNGHQISSVDSITRPVPSMIH